MMKTKILKYASYFLMIVGAILMSYSIPLSGDGRDWLLYLGSVMFNCGWIYLVLSDVKRRLKAKRDALSITSAVITLTMLVVIVVELIFRVNVPATLAAILFILMLLQISFEYNHITSKTKY